MSAAQTVLIKFRFGFRNQSPLSQFVCFPFDHHRLRLHYHHRSCCQHHRHLHLFSLVYFINSGSLYCIQYPCIVTCSFPRNTETSCACVFLCDVFALCVLRCLSILLSARPKEACGDRRTFEKGKRRAMISVVSISFYCSYYSYYTVALI